MFTAMKLTPTIHQRSISRLNTPCQRRAIRSLRIEFALRRRAPTYKIKRLAARSPQRRHGIAKQTNPMNTPAAEEVGVAAEVPTNFREALGKVGLTADELKQLGRLEYATPVVDLLVTVALMAAIPVIYRWLPNPITFVFCILLALHCFSRFAQLVHGSDHGCLFPNATANRWIGNLCAYV